MELIVANVDHIKFDIEVALDEQYGALPLPFPGMDKSTAAVCDFYTSAAGCQKGQSCPFRHVRGDRTIVCKHWLRGLCKKGDQCEFLHEYDMTKMPECYFYSRFNACHNKECPFLHIDPESKIKDCPWYDRGFCRHGPHCRHRHVRRVLCMNYIAGFCPDGPQCKYMHPQFDLPAAPDANAKDSKKPQVIICHYCGEIGHKISYCLKMTPEAREAAVKQEEAKLKALGYMKPPQGPPFGIPGAANGQNSENNEEMNEQQFDHPQDNPRQHNQHNQHNHHHNNQSQQNNSNNMGGNHPRMPPKPLEEVTCFKCGNKGHYANRCPKGHLAFLSQAKSNSQNLNNNR
ncbi:cleavage and polyadenylation specificity factor subunit 4 [Chrysoperla carnea]|uniref:cleavage and polyadenylation specificity factor subunit 4 n=1 Tax=Chrysoperla carnea TaxID=189513 RepID=UPI001D09256B|nr:cleavage and polyadenylation specificity factor subunit 4 [Chrysoperla carnea]